jgi:hypothetical protein
MSPMPVKRRVSKRKTLSPAVELTAWGELFTTGDDTFGELDLVGFAWTADGERAARAAAPEAWHRLGEAFMAKWEPDPGVRDEPWALQRFGKPWEVSRAR